MVEIHLLPVQVNSIPPKTIESAGCAYSHFFTLREKALKHMSRPEILCSQITHMNDSQRLIHWNHRLCFMPCHIIPSRSVANDTGGYILPSSSSFHLLLNNSYVGKNA